MDARVQKTQKRKTSSNRQQGYTLVELLVVLGVVAIILVFSFPVFEKAKDNAIRVKELNHFTVLRLAAMQFRKHRAQNGSTTNLTNVNTLFSNGYNIAPLTDGKGQNAYGNTIAITTANWGEDFTITSDVGSATECAYYLTELLGLPGGNNVATAPSCSGGTVSITYD
ncbi:prepilin-type N-terminal cleavage/methylation domain-containing protein [Porticoccaceae bacterium]|nr:prepilin-type N-terminal cleavage/methylation domain-containing protein [Porticoccaceae bacterium]